MCILIIGTENIVILLVYKLQRVSNIVPNINAMRVVASRGITVLFLIILRHTQVFFYQK